MASILVVDDSVVDRQLICGLLEKEQEFSVNSADNPNAALAELAKAPYDLVVTDLQMPDRDGLDLVRTMQMEFPHLPAILVTAHGSEKIAQSALLEGAAGYVPKSELATELVETVKNTLSLMSTEGHYIDLANYTTSTRFVFDLDNEPNAVPPLVDLTQQMITGVGMDNQIERLRCALALEHAIYNAMYHGNLELENAPGTADTMDEDSLRMILEKGAHPEYSDRRVHVEINMTRKGCSFVVEDDGPGFKTPDMQEITGGEKIANGGRGLVLIHSFMDHVEFSPKGNQIKMSRSWDESLRHESAERFIQQFDDTVHGNNLSEPTFGELVSERSGRTIPLAENRLVIGRRKTCHIVLPQREISAHHCQMYIVDGFWFVKDLESGNGIKINGKSVKRGRLDPGDTLTIAKYNYRINYSPADNGATKAES